MRLELRSKLREDHQFGNSLLLLILTLPRCWEFSLNMDSRIMTSSMKRLLQARGNLRGSELQHKAK